MFILTSSMHQISVSLLLHDLIFVHDFHSIDFARFFHPYLHLSWLFRITSNTFPNDPFPIVFNSSKSFTVNLGFSFSAV